MENNQEAKKSKQLNKIDSKLVFWILLISIISALAIVIVSNTIFDEYFQLIIFPCSVLIIDYGIIIKIAKYKINRKAYLWLIPLLLILISYLLLPIDPSNLFLNILILPILISFFFFSMINENYTISRSFIKWIFKLFPASIFANLKYIGNLYVNNVKEKNKKVLNILFGVCIGLPIAIIILNLLVSADQYFSAFISGVTDVLSTIFDLDFLISNLFIFSLSFLLCYTIFINAMKHKNAKAGKLTYYNLNYDITKTALIIVNAVFVLFLISELSKITTNFLSLPIEYTYAEYAREGFFQLLFVTAINFSIILFYIYYVKDAYNNKKVKGLLLALIAFSVLLIFNSYYRMFLYISNYGFTILRLQVILFLLMELVLFIIIGKKIAYKLKGKDAYLLWTVIIITYLVNLYYCIQPVADFLNEYIMK